MSERREAPLGTTASLAVSATQQIGTIDIRDGRTLVVTAKATTNAGAGSGVRVHALFSPDGSNWDTVDFASFDVDLSAGNNTQETHLIDVPETGYMAFTVENLDAGQIATDISLWASVRKWPCD